MGVVEDLADALARDAIEAAERLGDDRLVEDMARAIGAGSTTAEEAFLTAVRIRLAIARGRRFLEERDARAKGTAGPAPSGSPGT